MTRTPNPEPRWNPARLLESLTYFDVLPFSDTIRWLQSLGTPAAEASMLFSATAVRPRRSRVGILDPSRSLLTPLASRLGAAAIDLLATPVSTLADRDRLVALVVRVPPAETTAPTDDGLIDAMQRAIVRLDDDLAPQVVFDFCRDDADLRTLWGSVDDVVMGGVSESQAIATPSGLVFGGVVSTANSGGFASIRTKAIAPPLDLRGVETTGGVSDTQHPGANTGIELRLTGDGNRYKFILRDRGSWDGIAHCYSFETQPDVPAIVRVPFADCVPTFRAKSVPDCPRLDGSQIAAFQLMLSKFEYDQRLNPSFAPGAFRLLVSSIAAYRALQAAPVVMVGESGAIAIARSRVGDRVTDLSYLDLNTAIATITSAASDGDSEAIEAIVQPFDLDAEAGSTEQTR